MEIKELSRLKSQFVVREVGNELILVPLTSNIARMNEMFVINEVGKLIWENLSETTDVQSLTSLVLSQFDVDEDTAGKDVEAFLFLLEEKLNTKA